MTNKKSSYNYDYWLNNKTKPFVKKTCNFEAYDDNISHQYMDSEGNQCFVIDDISDALYHIKTMNDNSSENHFSTSYYKDFLNNLNYNDSYNMKSVNYNKNTNYCEKIDSDKYLKYKYTPTYNLANSESSESENYNEYCEQYSNMPNHDTNDHLTNITKNKTKKNKDLPIEYDDKTNTLIIGSPNNKVNMLVYGKIRYIY